VPIFAIYGDLPSVDDAQRRREEIGKIIETVVNSLPKKFEGRPSQIVVEYTDRTFLELGFTPQEATDALNVIFGEPGDTRERNIQPRRPTKREIAEGRTFGATNVHSDGVPPTTPPLITRYVDP
jgi:hypothetical protein